MSEMATVDLPWIKRFKDRHGRWRCYYRRRGFPSVKLPDVGEAGFLAAYEAAGARGKPKEGAGVERTMPGSIDALAVAYYRTADFQNLSAVTQRTYRGVIDAFRREHGKKRVATIEPKHIKKILADMGATPAQASNLRKRLRALFALAVDMEWRADNPVTSTKAPKYRTHGFTPWTEGDIAAFAKHWPAGTRQHLALTLLLYTGQRRSDVVDMGWQHVRGGRMHVCQVKGGKRLALRVPSALQAVLADTPKENMTFLLTQYGKPFSRAGFTNWFVEAARDAGLSRRTPHGLRKAAGRRLAEAGCSAHEIMAVLGHTTLAEAERYTKDANQAHLADAAVGRLENEELSNPAGMGV